MAVPPELNVKGRPPGPNREGGPDARKRPISTVSVNAPHVGRSTERIRVVLEENGCQPRGSGQRFRSRCPVHESHGLTLAVSQGRSGAVVKCHAQCETSEILAALGLCWDDLFDQPRERRPEWRPRRRPADDPMAELKRVLERAMLIINTRSAQHAYRERCPMPALSADERVELAEWASQEEADAHYWRVLARWAALACDEAYVREAYAQRAKWLRTGKWSDRPSHEQDMVLMTRAEDLAAAAAAEVPAA